MFVFHRHYTYVTSELDLSLALSLRVSSSSGATERKKLLTNLSSVLSINLFNQLQCTRIYEKAFRQMSHAPQQKKLTQNFAQQVKSA
jgi:hypothetical protein